MIKRLFSSQSKTITGAAIVLAAASFISRIIGVLRDRIFAHQFGAGIELDAYYAAFRIPDLVYNLLIVGALSAGFIPIFTSLFPKSKKIAWKVTSNVMNILGLCLIIVCTLLFIFTPQIMNVLVPGYSTETLNLTVQLTRIMFLSPILLGLSSVVSGVLQSIKCFCIYALTPIFYNLGIIFGAYVLVPHFGVSGLAYGVIIGALLHLAIQLPTLFMHGFKYSPILTFADKHTRKILYMMIPRTMGIGASQLNLLVITGLASTLPAGSLTVFNFANNIQYFPIGIIGYSFAIAAFPTLSELFNSKQTKKLTNHISKTIRQILFLILPITILLLLLRAQIVRVILGTGQFDWDATIATGDVLGFFALSLFAQATIPLLVRGFFALQDTWMPFTIGVISALINIIFSILLKDAYGVAGLAAAWSIASIIQLALLWIVLRKKLKTLHELPLIQLLYKISIASLFMALTVQSLKEPLARIVDMERFWGVFTQGFIAGTIGLLVYTSICYLLRVEELKQFTQSFRKKWLTFAPIQGEINEADEI